LKNAFIDLSNVLNPDVFQDSVFASREFDEILVKIAKNANIDIEVLTKYAKTLMKSGMTADEVAAATERMA
jgi:hypothetical protein